jgi:cytochrome c oxidase assembly protein subunit 15
LTQRAAAVAILALAQAAVGIVTLLLVVPVPAGLAHQALAMALFGMAVVHWRATALG